MTALVERLRSERARGTSDDARVRELRAELDRERAIRATLAAELAAAEAAVGLAILVVYFRNRGDIAFESVDLMKG